jgi:Rieske Fe-S protein
MATNRRVFLGVMGVGAAGVTINACVGVVGDTGLSTHDPGTGGETGTGGATGSGGETGTGGTTGTGGETGTGGSGAGGNGMGGNSGQGGSGTGGRLGTGGARVDAGVDTGTVLGPGDLAGGKATGIAVGTLNAIPGKTVAIGRDSMGLYAITLVCTHQGCTAAPAGATGARQVNCPCHGSQFDSNGAVIRGPAARPLVHFAVTVDAAGNVVVHTSTQVAATVRVMP